jgi:hypothetical protein
MAMQSIYAKKGNKRYLILRGFSLRDKKTGTQVKYGRGEPIPKAVLDDDDLLQELVHAGKIATAERDGTIRENPDTIQLSDVEIKRLVESPADLQSALTPGHKGQRAIRFSERSLLEIQRLLIARGAPQELRDLVQKAIEH